MALYCSPEYQTSFESIGLLVQAKKFKGFLDDGCGSHLSVPTETFLAIFVPRPFKEKQGELGGYSIQLSTIP